MAPTVANGAVKFEIGETTYRINASPNKNSIPE